MKYMLLIYGNQEIFAGLGPEEWKEAIAAQDAFNKKFFDTGEMVGAYGLADPENSKIVRVRDGAVAVTDGPYLEAKEYLASYNMIDVESEARALEIAAEAPYAAFRSIELWPVMHEAAADM
jgi:hypothetical protein